MKLLIITQKVDKNDPVLGFFHRWIEEFSKRFESVLVIALGVGEYSLPENVRVLSLGKESGASRLKYLWRFYNYIWRERKNYDSVFVHMNQEYVLLAGDMWRALGKRVYLWYVHREVTWKLWLAEKFVNGIFTSTPESFRLNSHKVSYLGHGIDTEVFSPFSWNKNSRTLVTVGRVTPIKRLEILLEALSILNKDGRDWTLRVVGGAVTEVDKKYEFDLKKRALDLGVEDNVEWLGPLSSIKVAQEFRGAFASVNLAPTGGMDKVVLESWSSGCPALVCNEAFREVFGSFSRSFIFYESSQNLCVSVRGLVKVQDDFEKDILIISNRVNYEFRVNDIINKIVQKIKC